MSTSTPNSQRYQARFEILAAKKEGAFVPFVTLGDPSLEQSFEVIKTLIDNGADALELGIPFSDPSADGVVIQQAGLRALNAGVTTDDCLQLLSEIRTYNKDIPIGLLIYANLVFARGLDTFYQDVAKAGVDSVLIADLPIRESAPFINSAKKYGVAPIFIAPPNGSEETLKKVADLSEGYTYVLSRAGVTGTESTVQMPANELLANLQAFGAPPPVLGFGISTPEHVKQAIDSGARGAISGSATVKLIEQNLDDANAMVAALATFTQEMKAATKSS